MSNKESHANTIWLVVLACVSSLILGGVLVDNKWENRMKHNNVIHVISKYYKVVEVKPSYSEVQK